MASEPADIDDFQVEAYGRLQRLAKRVKFSPEDLLAIQIDFTAAFYLAKVDIDDLAEIDLRLSQLAKTESEVIPARIAARGALAKLVSEGINKGNAIQYIEGRLRELAKKASGNS